MKSKTIALAYPVELYSNSLFYKLSKTFRELDYNVIAIGVKRGVKESKISVTKVGFNVGSGSDSSDKIVYIEIPVGIRYAGGMKNFFGIIKYQLLLLKELRKRVNNIDILYAIDFLMAVPMFFVAVTKGKRFVYHIADKFIDAYKVPKVLKPFFSFLDSLLIRYAPVIVVPDKSRIDRTLEKYRDKVFVIYNSPEDIFENNFEFREIPESSNLRLAYFGTLTEDRFIKELCTVVIENGSLELHIGGLGPLEDFVLTKAKECERIKYYGKVPYDFVLNIQKDVDLLVAMYDPSIENNKRSSPNKLFEAMMLGKPIIVSQGMGIDEFVKDNNLGFVCEYSINEFSKLISSILKIDKCNLKLFGSNARKIYEKEYSWSMMKEKIRSFLSW
ncbi:MAG: glycosyltransferase [Thermoplasmata archaeon]